MKRKILEYIVIILFLLAACFALAIWIYEDAEAKSWEARDGFSAKFMRLSASNMWYNWLTNRTITKGGETLEQFVASEKQFLFFLSITKDEKYTEDEFLIAAFNIPPYRVLEFKYKSFITLRIATEYGDTLKIQSSEIISCDGLQTKVRSTNKNGFVLKPIDIGSEPKASDLQNIKIGDNPFRYIVTFARFPFIPVELFKVISWEYEGITLKGEVNQ